jgi:hypothetical protein
MSLLSANALGGIERLKSTFDAFRQTAGQSLSISDYSDQLQQIQLAAESIAAIRAKRLSAVSPQPSKRLLSTIPALPLIHICSKASQRLGPISESMTRHSINW